MALTLEAALVLPLSISLILSVIPAANQRYRQSVKEAMVMKQGVLMTTDPGSLYAFAPITDARVAPSTGTPSGTEDYSVLMTSPKRMFCLVTAVMDDLRLLGLAEP